MCIKASGIKKAPKKDDDILPMQKAGFSPKISIPKRTRTITIAETITLSAEKSLKKYKNIKNADAIARDTAVCGLYFFEIIKYS
jgi:hypothetical protein